MLNFKMVNCTVFFCLFVCSFQNIFNLHLIYNQTLVIFLLNLILFLWIKFIFYIIRHPCESSLEEKQKSIKASKLINTCVMMFDFLFLIANLILPVPGQIKSVLSVNEKPTLAAIMYWGISQPVLFYFHAQIFWALILGI